jgi:hypothetical protein
MGKQALLLAHFVRDGDGFSAGFRRDDPTGCRPRRESRHKRTTPREESITTNEATLSAEYYCFVKPSIVQISY